VLNADQLLHRGAIRSSLLLCNNQHIKQLNICQDRLRTNARWIDDKCGDVCRFAQGQRVKATDVGKTLLQPDDVGVGLWLESGDCNVSAAGGAENAFFGAICIYL
jgi:hypothetical protein